MLLAKQQPSVPATTKQSSGATIDGQANEVIPESRGLGYSGTINMPGQPGNGINDSYVPPVTQSRQTNIQNRTENQVAGTNIDPMQGVTQSAAEGALLGFLSGGPMGAGGGALNSSNSDGSQVNPEDNSTTPQTDNYQQTLS